MKQIFALMTVIVMTLSGCATNQEKSRAEFESRLCDAQYAQPSIVTNRIVQYGEMAGEGDTHVNEPNLEWKASALAVTRDDTLRPPREGWSECCQWVPGYIPRYNCAYQYCRKFEGHSLTGILGLARAADIGQAENMALKNCETALQQFARSFSPTFLRSTQQCKIFKSKWCD